MNDAPMHSQSTDLAIIPVGALPTILAADENDIFGKLFAELKGFNGDASTERGRTEIKSKAAKVSTAKQDLLRLGKSLKEEHLRIQKSIVAEEKVIEDRFDALRDQIRAPVTEYENREKQRVADHEAALAAITESPGYGEAETIADLELRLDYLTNYPERNWQEFAARAKDALARELDRTAGLLAAARKREAEARELEELRAEQARRQREAEAAERKGREEQIARDAAETARKAAEEKAAREAREAEARAQAALRAQAEAAERREREVAEALARAEREKIAAEEKAARDQAAAVEAERQRVAREASAQKAEDEKRAANRAHRATINREVMADLIAAINDNQGGELSTEKTEDIAKAVITWIAKGQVRHMTIGY